MSNDIAKWVLEGQSPEVADIERHLAESFERALSAMPMTREQLADSCAKQIQQFLDALSASGLVDRTPISAGWLRECGIPVPDAIPDCATVPRSAMHLKLDDAAARAGGDAITVGMQATFDEPFRWFEAKVIVGEPRLGSDL